jgi:hypothetical protein
MPYPFAGGDVLDAGTLNAIYEGTLGKPVGRAVQSAAQTITDNGASALPITFATEDYDTAGAHDVSTNTSRVTPNKAGYYRFVGIAHISPLTTAVTIGAVILKNGAPQPSWDRIGPGTGSGSRTAQAIAMLPMNGTTDYAEVGVFQDSAGNVTTSVAGSFTSTLEWEFVRPL